MVQISPFASYAAEASEAADIAALPYDVFTRQQAADEIALHPKSFLRIDKAAALLPEAGEYDADVYTLTKDLLTADIAAGLYQFDPMPRFYLYSMTWDEDDATQPTGDIQIATAATSTPPIRRRQLGLVASVDAADYLDGTIRRHENTRPEKLADRIAHIKALDAQTGPVLMAHRPDQTIAKLLEELHQSRQPCIDFTAPDGIRHSVWTLDAAINHDIQAAYAKLDALYIADGHHRAQAASETGSQGMMAILFPSDELAIEAYNRVAISPANLTPARLLHRLTSDFTVQQVATAAEAQPVGKGRFALYMNNAWYKLTLDEGLRPRDVLAGLDVSVLHDRVLGPLLGIEDPRTSPRITYVGGSLGLDGLARRADDFGGGEAMAFGLYPVAFDDFFAVADSGRLMPPKSTWFVPKPRSGLLIRPLGA